jgi:stage II sporulation protein D
MKGQTILKWLKQRPWFSFSLLGGLALGSVLLLGSVLRESPQPVPAAIVASSPSSVKASVDAVTSPSPAPLAAKSETLPSPAAKLLPSPSPATAKPSPSAAASPVPEPQPSLTAEQEAQNRQAKAAFDSSQSSVDALIEMRVAIAKGVPTLTLSLSASADLIDQSGDHKGTLSPNTPYTASASGETVSVGGYDLTSPVWIEPAIGGMFTLGDRTYRGRLLLAASESHLWGVNFVNLRQYLYSVVASEVSPSWPLEALKAQAVAARSYALTYFFKPVNSLYQIGDDEYFQVYSGVEREAAPSNQAVDATAGEFVSYRGGIVESLYAASDDIVADAFHGKGMSQLGALGLAEQGYTYQQILANYYPSTGVGRIQQDYE